MRKPTAVPAATLAVVLALVVSACGGSSNGSPGASSTSTTTPGSTAATGGGQPSAPAWCAMVIDISAEQLPEDPVRHWRILRTVGTLVPKIHWLRKTAG
jgi:hypothetical protein